MGENISIQTLQRLPVYLNYLKSEAVSRGGNISAGAIAAALGLGEIQVRKDLAQVSSGGRPKLGYCIEELKNDIETFLGCNDTKDAVLVGAGKLGRALLEYSGFAEYGLEIVAAFDSDPAVIGEDGCNGKKILPAEKLADLCRRMNIHIGIITVPAAHAQKVCDALVEGGVRAIWNFAPCHLEAPDNILVKSENMAISLAVLSRHLTELSEKEK